MQRPFVRPLESRLITPVLYFDTLNLNVKPPSVNKGGASVAPPALPLTHSSRRPHSVVLNGKGQRGSARPARHPPLLHGHMTARAHVATGPPTRRLRQAPCAVARRRVKYVTAINFEWPEMRRRARA